jgi:prophage DNA circulation protein
VALPSDIRPASFRGVPFEAREVSRSGGRRVSTSALPQRDAPYSDDMGRSIRRWRLAAFIVGTATVDEDANKQRLIEALEAPGPGVLIHPTDGRLMARAEPFDVSQSSDAHGVVSFSLQFVEAGEVVAPTAAKASQLETVSARLRTSVRTAQSVRREGLTGGAKTRDLLAGDVEDRAQALLAIGGRFVGTDTSEFSSLLSGMVDTADSLVTDSDDEADAWIDAFEALDDPPDRRTVLGRLYELAEDAIAAAGTGGLHGLDLELANESRDTAIGTHTLALCASAEVLGDDTFDAYDDALAVLDELLASIDLDEPLTNDPTALAALQDLRDVTLQALQDAAMNLPRLRTLVVPAVVTALELAYDLYGDATRSDEIVERNNIADPLAVSGSILVLTE